jgi:peptide chain release factor 2
MELYEVNKKIEYFKENLEALNRALNPDEMQNELKALNKEMLEPNFWNDTNRAKKITKDASNIQNKLGKLKNLANKLNDIIEWLGIAEENTEEWELLENDILNYDEEMKDFEIETLLSNPYDENNAILEIHSGAGGTESQDWCEMLFRMYTRYTQ